ncbi:hypothetical protein D1AOALGA4SA_10084 [Olavius algarvensis Delta 1 endosymbiont]|nr:hypothetical protein D1AOALGA4SA_10084 [Olavius algarvensis Delta 1 endosymbiont]
MAEEATLSRSSFPQSSRAIEGHEYMHLVLIAH